MSDPEGSGDRAAGMGSGATGGAQPAELEALREVVDALRHAREEAERRAARLENELTALRLNERILEAELRAARAHAGAGAHAGSPADDPGFVRTAEHEQLRAEHAQLCADHARLQDEHTRQRDEYSETAARLDVETRTLREVEAARVAADGFAADTSRDLGEAMSDLLEARERGDKLEAELTSLRSAHAELITVHDELRVRAASDRETAERNLAEQRRVHDALRADAAAAHERQLHQAAAAHERGMLEADERCHAAELRTQEVAAQLRAMTHHRDQLQVDLEKSLSAAEVARQRLREEIDAREAAEERRSMLEDELDYLRAEVFAPGQTTGRKRGVLGRRGRGSPGRSRAETGTVTSSASRSASEMPEAPVALLADDDIDSVLERRLFGE